MATKVEGKNDDLRRLSLDDIAFPDDVFMMDTTLEALLYGKRISQSQTLVDVSVPQIKRSY